MEVRASEAAKDEGLLSPPGRPVNVVHRLQQLERVSQFGAEARGGISRDVQAAAALGSIGSERGDDGLSSRPQGAGQSGPVGLAIVRIGEEMEHGPVVPESIGLLCAPRGEVGLDESNAVGLLSEPIPHPLECSP